MKTTKEHYRYFVERCEYWVSRYGLTEWTITYEHGSSDREDLLAWCSYSDTGAQNASIGLSEDWAESIDKRKLEIAAHEEITHLLLAPLMIVADRRYGVTELDLATEEHKVIKRLRHEQEN